MTDEGSGSTTDQQIQTYTASQALDTNRSVAQEAGEDGSPPWEYVFRNQHG